MADDESKTPENNQNEPFKKPVLIGRVGKLPKKAKSEPEKPVEEKPPEKFKEPIEYPSESSSKSIIAPQDSSKESASIAYKEPKWSGLCPDGSAYSLEVLKSGLIVERVDLTKQPYFVFGRLPNCDVIMAHPTISRHHCILQYKACADADEPSCGWYLYDLGSTHGTYLNKDKLKSSHYTRVRVGHQIKFGNSTRTYILVGPDFDCDGESELTVTEIKQRAVEMKEERDRMIQEAAERRGREEMEEAKKREEQGIDWGMGEDADDETDLSENPFAVTSNEDLYLADPKKTLRGFFEREGHELQYNCEERGQGQYICKVELPLRDARGRGVLAEALHRGKKKEAVLACALEACRVLDRAGLLRQAKHESRRPKERDWSADDFYDSDDDNYLDRTGHVERRRRGRMQRHGALQDEQEALTYEQLLKQVSDLQSKIAAEEGTLERLRASIRTNKQTDEQADDLDMYMASLSAPSMSVKAEISTSKMTLQKLKVELAGRQRLVELARPAHLPPLIKQEHARIRISNSVVYGKRIKLKADSEKKPTPKQASKQEDEFVEEVDSDEESSNKQNDAEDRTIQNTEHLEGDLEEGSSKSSRNIKNIGGNDSATDKTCKNDTGSEKTCKKCTGTEKTCKNNTGTKKTCKNDTGTEKSCKEGSGTDIPKKMYGPMRPPDNYVIPEGYFDQESDRDLPEIMESE